MGPGPVCDSIKAVIERDECGSRAVVVGLFACKDAAQRCVDVSPCTREIFTMARWFSHEEFMKRGENPYHEFDSNYVLMIEFVVGNIET